jgi:hypothetical protein
VAVHARTRNCSFAVTASTSLGVITLQDGAQQMAAADMGETRYFEYAMAGPEAELQIAVTPISGHVALHVGTVSSQGPFLWPKHR